MEEKQLDTETETTTNVDTEADTNDVDFSSMSDEEFLEYLNHEKKEEEENNEEEESNTDTDTTDTDTETEETSTDTETDTDKESDIDEETSDMSQEDKDLLKQVFSEGFKAKGKIIKPKTMQEFLSLAQQGVDYNIKNREINNSKRQLQSLTNAGIKTLEDLNFALDLYKGDVEAIKKLVKDKGIELYNLDLEEDTKYNPNTNNIVSSNSVAFNDIVSSIKDKPYYNEVESVILDKWDEESRKTILSDNAIFRALIEEFDLDRFQTISELVDHERAFGRLEGLNDLQAYSAVAYQYEQQQKKKQEQKAVVNKPIEKPKDVDVNKKAITQTKGADSSKPAKKVYSLEELAKLSDEEYMKLYNSGALDE